MTVKHGKRTYIVVDGKAQRVRSPKARPRTDQRIIDDTYALLRDPMPDEDVLREALQRHPKYRRLWRGRTSLMFDRLATITRLYRERYGDLPRGMHVRAAKIELSPPGRPLDKRTGFRSEWETRLGDALTRLGIRWAYEPRKFDWVDAAGKWHTYLPDFQLLDFRQTFVEVKGPRGAYGDDQFKMNQVLASHPSLVLLLWDSDTVEYIEDMDSADQVIALLSTTRLAA